MAGGRGRARVVAAAFVVGLVVLPMSAVAAPGAAATTVQEKPGSGDQPGTGAGDDTEAPGRDDGGPGRSGEIGSSEVAGETPDSHGASHEAADHGLAAAMVMLDLGDDGEVAILVTPAQPAGLSGDIISALSPVMPPGLVDAVTSPVVVFEALLEAMVASRQALVIPLVAAGVGLCVPALRRRGLLAAVVERD